MREIKFRAFDPVAQEMKYSPRMHRKPDGTLWASNDSDSTIVPLMQFTGLLDRDGVEIYEGDIVKSSAHHPDTYKVTFGDCHYYAMTMSGPFITIELDHFEDSTGCCLEVIGNIHQTPELLK